MGFLPYGAADTKHDALEMWANEHLHRTLPWQGDRYAIVCFNCDWTQHDRLGLHWVDERTEEIRNQPYFLPRIAGRIPSEGPIKESIESLEKQLIKSLEDVKWTVRENLAADSIRKQSKYTERSETLYFGELVKAFKPKERSNSVATDTYPLVYSLLRMYIESRVPEATRKYRTFLIAKNSYCTWHRDRHNAGPSLFLGFGDYTEGEVEVCHERMQTMQCHACRTAGYPVRKCREGFGHTAPNWINYRYEERKTVTAHSNEIQ